MVDGIGWSRYLCAWNTLGRVGMPGVCWVREVSAQKISGGSGQIVDEKSFVIRVGCDPNHPQRKRYM